MSLPKATRDMPVIRAESVIHFQIGNKDLLENGRADDSVLREASGLRRL